MTCLGPDLPVAELIVAGAGAAGARVIASLPELQAMLRRLVAGEVE